MTQITVAALQLAFGPDIDANIQNVSRLVREAASRGAQVILPPELFEGEYFCRVEDEALFANAAPVGEHKAVLAMQALAEALRVTIPTSFFEADGQHHYNSLAMIGPDGEVQGVYRKSHIPDGPGYEEKFYFRPGNTGFKTWPAPPSAPGWTLGVGVCWDQWYPETARSAASRTTTAWTPRGCGAARWSGMRYRTSCRWSPPTGWVSSMVRPFTGPASSPTNAATFLPNWTAKRKA